MSVATANNLLAELGARLEMPELKFDDQGYCTIGFDEHIVNFERAKEGDTISIFVWMCVVPEERRAEAALQIGDANYLFQQTHGATLGLNRYEGDAVLALQVSLAEMTPAQFEQIVENMVNLAEAWKKRLLETPDSKPVEPAASPAHMTRWLA